ncbi:MAG: AAA family ATPase [Muribaculaceae bacterium]|nr:AAA family ATPase [Muribaculaceae bacterium]
MKKNKPKNQKKKQPDEASGEIKTEELDFDRLLDEFIKPELFVPQPDNIADPLDSLTGLHNVKNRFRTFEKVTYFNRWRALKGLPTLDLPLHAVFMGSPGTGKTTVAKALGRMLRRAGVLSRGHLVVMERSTLLGQNYNAEAEKTLEAIEKAQGGILLIDEAYQLYQPCDPRDPGKFVIETLLTAMSDEGRRDWMLILAGYTDRMKHMMYMNPGLRSRIPEANIYEFEDFSEAQLMEIAERYFESNGYVLRDDAHTALAQLLHSDYAARGEDFGNARHVINIIQTQIIPAMATRLADVTEPGIDDLSEIHAADIPQPTLHKNIRRRAGFTI